MLNIQKIGQPKNPSLTLIHGWGAQNAVWSSWANTYLAQHFCLTLIELPGFGNSPTIKDLEDEAILPAWTNAILQVMPEQTILLGWSLGGLLAQHITMEHPHRVRKLICLASTPRFTQNDNWKHAVSPTLMRDFIQSVQIDSVKTLSHFWKLQRQGDGSSRKELKQFITDMQALKFPSLIALIQGLKLLNQMDHRDQIDHIKCPSLWLLGEQDPLITANAIRKMMTKHSNTKTHLITGAGHTPFQSHPMETAEAILEFLNLELS